MPTLTIKTPQVITLCFRQDKEDPDFGTCLWADFNIDLEKYNLSIASDCGDFMYSGWTPTPESECFLHLLSRIEGGYLLYKLTNKSCIDGVETSRRFERYISELEEDVPDESKISKPDRDRLRRRCLNAMDDSDFYSEVMDILEDYEDLSKLVESDYLYDCIVKDYTPNEKKISEIFTKYIAPKCRELCKGAKT